MIYLATAHHHPLSNVTYDNVDGSEVVMESHCQEISSVPASQGRLDKAANPVLLCNTNGHSAGETPRAVNLKGAHIQYEVDVNYVREINVSQTRQKSQINVDVTLPEVSS